MAKPSVSAERAQIFLTILWHAFRSGALSQPSIQIPLLQRRPWRYRKTINHNTPGFNIPKRKQLCLGICRCVNSTRCTPPDLYFVAEKMTQRLNDEDYRSTNGGLLELQNFLTLKMFLLNFKKCAENTGIAALFMYMILCKIRLFSWLLARQYDSHHQPVELFPGQVLYLGLFPRPLINSRNRKPLIDEDIAVRYLQHIL